MKKCTKCKKEQSLSEFTYDSRHKDGHTSVCKTCSREHTAAYLKAHPKLPPPFGVKLLRKMIGSLKKKRQRTSRPSDILEINIKIQTLLEVLNLIEN